MRCIKTERASLVGLTLMVGALGCGGKAAEDANPAEPSYSVPRDTPPSPPRAATPQRPQVAPVAPREEPPPPYRPLPEPPFESESDLAKAAVENVLAANCGQCHGPSLTRAQAQDGINFINDIDALVQAGLIVPYNSAASRIIVVMRDGSMPPPASGLPPVTQADIATVAVYIDEPRFWTDLPPPIVDAGTEAPLVDAGPDAD